MNVPCRKLVRHLFAIVAILGALTAAGIPAVGPFVFMGWLITGFWGRDDQRPETFPDFDFNHFVKYMERGLWPFLVSLVTSLVIAIPMMVLWFGFIFGVVGMDSRRHGAHGASEGPGLLLGLGFVAKVVLLGR